MVKIKSLIHRVPLPDITPVYPLILLLSFLFLTRFHSYLLFHTATEIFSMIVCLGAFMFAWNTRQFIKNNYFLLIGVAAFFVAMINFLHLMTYKGMQIFTGITTNIPTQLWLAQRYLFAVSFLIALFFIHRKLQEVAALTIYGGVTVLAIASILLWQVFPTSYIEGIGLTGFKIVSEYIIIFLFLTSIVFLRRFRRYFDAKVLYLLTLSLILSCVAETLFTNYFSVSDIFNQLGHIAVLLSYYFFYKAIIETGLSKPFNLLFLELHNLERRKDEFLHMASHELKNPLTTIRLYSDLLFREYAKTNDTKHMKPLVVIDKEIKTMTTLINDLLDIGKIEADQLTLRPKICNLSQLVKQIVTNHKKLYKDYDFTFTCQKPVKAKIDKDRIAQVVSNLLTNAVKYSPQKREICVSVTLQSSTIVVMVKDHGIGISKKNLSNIFDKYYRTQSAETKAAGLGLGLYIAKRIVELHHGHIWVESHKGKGSSFFFSLPAVQ